MGAGRGGDLVHVVPMDDPVARFFAVVLPHLVVRSFTDFASHRGTLNFNVEDAGSWTLTFGSAEPVQDGEADDAGLSLAFTRVAFLAFIEGTLDIAAAVEQGDVCVLGEELELLERLGRLLSPPQDNLGWSAG